MFRGGMGVLVQTSLGFGQRAFDPQWYPGAQYHWQAKTKTQHAPTLRPVMPLVLLAALLVPLSGSMRIFSFKFIQDSTLDTYPGNLHTSEFENAMRTTTCARSGVFTSLAGEALQQGNHDFKFRTT